MIQTFKKISERNLKPSSEEKNNANKIDLPPVFPNTDFFPCKKI